MKPAEEMARLKKELAEAREILGREGKPGATGAEQKAAVDRYERRTADLARRARALAEAHPDAPEAPEALVWIITITGGGRLATTEPVSEAAYDLMARGYLDRDAIIPVIWITCGSAAAAGTAPAESFLRAAAERSSNQKVRALARFGLGLYRQELIDTARDLGHPLRGESVRAWLGPERVRQIRALEPEQLRREAEAHYERTIEEYGDLRPLGEDGPPMGDRARGDLFRLRHLEPGRTVPEIEGEDIDGWWMKLSDFRGKVIVISFWTTWCGPCLAMVPDEKALVDRMKGRPFVLVGVNGDADRSRARKVAVERGMNWQSFWDGGPQQGTAVRWGVHAWPTVYLIDEQGVIRDRGTALRGAVLDEAVEELVAKAEATAKTS
jgi:thiol-disulfide isomerase/thioredoxin